MVHHNEWDRAMNHSSGYMQKDKNEMEEIIKEMSPGGKHYHPFNDGNVLTDSQILRNGASSETVHKGAPYDRSLPSFYHGHWYKSSHSALMSITKVMAFIVVVFVALKFVYRSATLSTKSKR